MVAVIVLTLWLDTAISPYAAVRALAIGVAGAVLLAAVAGVLVRSIAIGALVATAVIAVLWSKQVTSLLVRLAEPMGPVALAWWVLLAAAAALAARLARRKLRKWSTERVTLVANRISFLLFAATLMLGLLNGRLPGAIEDLRQGIGLAAWRETPGSASASGPDIYLVLLDGYPRADVLEFAFGTDNAAFIGALEERGFSIASAAHSDYLWTQVSVPAALNMAYVEHIPAMRAVMDGRLPRQPTLRRAVANNVAFDTARAHGYTPIGIGSGFEEVAPRQADVYVDGGQLNEFELSLLWSTYLGDVVSAVAPDFASSQQRNRILHNLAVLPEIAATRDRGPVFTFAHIPAPHQPVVFAADGSGVTVPITSKFYADSPPERAEDPVSFRAKYRAQLPYLNERIVEAIDAILRASERPPVIVLFADHGSASVVDWNAVEPEDADPAHLLERTGILFAALTPETPGLFPNDISPTNMVRLLFDAYLDTDFGLAVPPPGGGQVSPVSADVLKLD